MDEIEVPSYFLCPISLQMMRDPVTLSTGISYDRESIEKWMFSGKKSTCPVTKQPISLDADLTPNHTLRRLIQAWCTLNASRGVERFPTPKPPLDKAQILKLINVPVVAAPHSQIQSLRKLKVLASESDRNKRCMESAGAIDFLASIVKNNYDVISDFGVHNNNQDGHEASEEALSILYNMKISEAGLKKLIGKNGEFIDSLVQVLRHGNYQCRAYATLLLKHILAVADSNILTSLKSKLFLEIVTVLKDQISQQALKAGLKILIGVCPWGRNRVKAVDAGAVSILVELLLDTTERRSSEIILTALDQLCGCAEGRAELLKHGCGIAVVSKKILRVSHVGSERAVRILYSISRFAATASVVQEMLQVGVAAKLCLVLQVECTTKTKEKAKEILRTHSRVWKNSSCIPGHLISSYPC